MAASPPQPGPEPAEPAALVNRPPTAGLVEPAALAARPPAAVPAPSFPAPETALAARSAQPAWPSPLAGEPEPAPMRLARVPAADAAAIVEARRRAGGRSVPAAEYDAVTPPVLPAPDAAAAAEPDIAPLDGESFAATLARLAGTTPEPAGASTSVVLPAGRKLAREAPVNAPAAPAPQPARAPRPAPVPTAPAPAGARAESSGPDLDELYDQLASRLKRELLDDRERRGDLLDPGSR